MKKELNICDTLPQIKKRLKYTNEQLATALGVDPRSVVNYLNGQNPTPSVFKNIINIIENNSLDIFELFDLDGDEYLFHGSRTEIKGKITTKHNVNRLKDFGDGFYLSENFKTAITYVDNEDFPHVYRFKKSDVMKEEKFTFGNSKDDIIDWVLYIGLNRKKIKNKEQESFLKEYFQEKFSNKRLLIGKIADSFNFETMDAFFAGDYDVFQVQKSLLQVSIGNQIVIKDESDANAVVEFDEFSIEPRLKKYINDWHSRYSSILKSQNIKLIDAASNAEYKFESIIRKKVDEYVGK